MTTGQWILLIAFGLVVVLAAARLFTAPLRMALKLLLNTVLGFVGLFVFNMIGSYIGVTVGVNLLNAVIVAVLGLPGFGLLLLLPLVFG